MIKLFCLFCFLFSGLAFSGPSPEQCQDNALVSMQIRMLKDKGVPKSKVLSVFEGQKNWVAVVNMAYSGATDSVSPSDLYDLTYRLCMKK